MTAENGRIPANVFVRPKLLPDDTFLFDYSLFFISTLHDLLEQEEDEELLHDLYPIAQKQMDLALTQVDGQGALLLTEEIPVFIDWSNDFSKDTAGQAVMLYALKQFISLTEHMQLDPAKYEEVYQRMKGYALEKLFDKEKHLFVSGSDREINIASQTWMVIAGILDKDENQEVMQAAYQELFPIKNIATPYMYHHIAEALCLAGMKNEATCLIKSYWGKMLALGADTFWEAFDPEKPDYSPYGSPMVNSYCHAWACTPIYLLKKYF